MEHIWLGPALTAEQLSDPLIYDHPEIYKISSDQFHLKAEDDAYVALEANKSRHIKFDVLWPGETNDPPSDWDGGTVLLEYGQIWLGDNIGYWERRYEGCDVIAYTRRKLTKCDRSAERENDMVTIKRMTETEASDWAIEKAKANHPDKELSVKWVKKKPDIYWLILEYARHIEAHEKPPVDRKLLCAREAAVFVCGEHHRQEIESGEWDKSEEVITPQRAITLYEQGFGK